MSNPNSQEVELKLSCSPATARKLGPRLTELTGSLPSQQLLRNTYYDTSQQTLRQQGAALRIRVQGRQRLQTVKCAGQSQGGLSARPEWETPYRGAFDFSPITDLTVRHQLQALADNPGFEATLTTDFTRTTWVYRPSPAIHILLMLDRGHIEAAGRRAHICELELELVKGSANDLLQLARQLNQIGALFPSPLSKAARGGLLLDQSPTPRRQPRPASTAQNCGAAFAFLMQDCLDQISLHHPANCQPFTAENLHQVRIGLRHLVALLQLFSPGLKKNIRNDWLHTTHAHLHALGTARNLDVLENELVRPCLSTLGARELDPLLSPISTAADNAFKEAIAYLQSPLFSRWLLGCSLDLQQSPPVRKSWCNKTWKTTAQQRLAKQLQSYTAQLAEPAHTPKALHRLRLQGKRLRYCLDTLPQQNSGRTRQSLIQLQNSLGQLNDLYTAGKTLQPLLKNHPELQPRISRVGQLHVARHDSLHKDLSRQIKALKAHLQTCLARKSS